MVILGVSCFYHDAAAALIEDGRIVAAAEEERFSRVKHDFGFPEQAITVCLSEARIGIGDVDYVVFYEKPFLKFERILKTTLSTFPKSHRLFREAMVHWLREKLWIKGLIKDRLNYEGEVLFIEHHLSHAASCFLPSPFDEAAILTADGVGEWATTTLGVGKGREIELFREIRFPHSLGLLYSAFTAFLGFKVNEGEYKVMGMAPYGKPKYVDKVRKVIEVSDDGGFWLDMAYLSYHRTPDRTFSGRFAALFGKPRDPRESGILDPFYADIAASIQAVTEACLLNMAWTLYRETGLKKLCLAGGVALNSVANGRLFRETPFEELYIQPAAGDSGGAIGAALYVYHTLLGNSRAGVQEHAYLGPRYGNGEVVRLLRERGIAYTVYEDDERLMDRVVDHLTEGKVIGWYQDRMEWGPRALGHRSILADPRRPDMKDIVNRKIKFREPFRPFAPSVLVEHTEAFFDLPDAERHYPARFMLYVVDVKAHQRDRVPAITHVDGTARVQTVHRRWSPRYHRLIEKFGEATGVPVVLNTSFNLRGEPIVCTPGDAVETFFRSGMDVLVMGKVVVEK